MPRRHKRQRKQITKPARTERAADPKLPVWKKLIFSLVVLCVLLPACELVLLLAGVRPVLFDEDPYVGFSSQIPLFVERAGPDGAAVMATARNKLRFFNMQQFPREKSAGAVRIFCMGGSTTYGRPYDDRTSFCGWLRAFLAEADPSRQWEVINAGGISYASYRAAALIKELTRYEPDVFIVYSGHNEFLERRTYANIIKTPSAIRELGALLSRARTYATVKRLWVWTRGKDARPQADGREVLPGEVEAILDTAVGPAAYTRDDELARQIVAHYRVNLERMVDIARTAGAKVLLVTPASNLKDSSPFKSEHRADLSEADWMRWQELYGLADRAEKDGRAAEALKLLAKAAAIDDRHAHLHYRTGRVLYDLQEYARAKKAFVRAVDEDICPLRALSSIQGIVGQVAAERKVPLIDFAAMVESRSKHGIPGEDLFFDHVHPTVDGNRRLALAILNKLVAEKIVRPAPTWNAKAVERVAAAVKSRTDPKADAVRLLNLSKVLAWAGKFKEAHKLAEQARLLDPNNPEVHYNLGVTLQWTGKHKEAAAHCKKAIEIRPRYAEAHSGLGYSLMHLGELDEARTHVELAIKIKPSRAEFHFGLGEVLVRQDRPEEAIQSYRKALDINPELARAHVGLGSTLLAQGKPEAALVHLEKAVALQANNAKYRFLLANALAAQGKLEAAVAQYRRAVAIDPYNLGAVNNLAWLLATRGALAGKDSARAVELAQRACGATGNKKPVLLDTLAAAYAADGQFGKAVDKAKQAIALAKSSGQRKLAGDIQRRLDRYQAGKPWDQH